MNMRVNNNRLSKFNIVFLCILLAVNAWIFIDRDNGYAFTGYLNYNELYQDPEISRWQHVSPYISPQETEKAEQMLTDSMGILASDSTPVKIKKISGYILSVLDKCRGRPSDMMKDISPLAAFEMARNGSSLVWCGNFADIFSFFAGTAGIVTRYVAEEGDKNNVHVFNECFIKESGGWMMVDLTSKLIASKNSSGQYMNTVDIYNSHLSEKSPLIVCTYINDSIATSGYPYVREFYEPYFNRESIFVFYTKDQFDENLYSTAGKFKRYITSSPTFFCYAEDEKPSNIKFYFKALFFYLLIFFMLYSITFQLTRSKNR